MENNIIWAKTTSYLVSISLSAFLCAKTALQWRRRRYPQKGSKFSGLLEFPGTLLFIAASLTIAAHTILLRRTYHNQWLDDKAYKCIDCSGSVDILDSFFEALTWTIALYVLWRVAKQQGGWRGTISRVLLYGGCLCAVIIVLCTLFNAVHTPKELPPLDQFPSDAPQNHTASVMESIASPTTTGSMSANQVFDSDTKETKNTAPNVTEEQKAMAEMDTPIESLSQASPQESLPSSEENTTEPLRLADVFDFPAVISWVLHTGAQWSMAGLVPLLAYIQREQIPSIRSFAVYGVLVTLLPVVTAVCRTFGFLYTFIGYAYYSPEPLGSSKFDEETMNYFSERSQTCVIVVVLLLQYMPVVGLYLVAWFGHRWEAPHLRQHLHGDHDAYQFESVPHDAKLPILDHSDMNHHVRQGRSDNATAIDVELIRRSV